MLATLRRVAPAQTLPRGESGLEAGDGSVAQTCSSVLPRRSLDRFRRGFVFSEKEYWDQLPSLSSESKREASHGAFFAPGLPYGFLAGYPVLPTQQSILSRPRAIAPHAVSLQSEKHSGDYRENEAGMDCEPLQQSFIDRFGRRRVEAWFIPMKSHTPECAKIEQFAATVTPLKSYDLCVQDFDTKDYTLEFCGRSITITQQEFADGSWQEIVRSALQVNVRAHSLAEGGGEFGF